MWKNEAAGRTGLRSATHVGQLISSSDDIIWHRLSGKMPLAIPEMGQGTVRSHHTGPGWGVAVDQELLVDNRIEDGEKLLAQLVRSGFDVTALAG
jgi:hypothetical protein